MVDKMLTNPLFAPKGLSEGGEYLKMTSTENRQLSKKSRSDFNQAAQNKFVLILRCCKLGQP